MRYFPGTMTLRALASYAFELTSNNGVTATQTNVAPVDPALATAALVTAVIAFDVGAL